MNTKDKLMEVMEFTEAANMLDKTRVDSGANMVSKAM